MDLSFTEQMFFDVKDGEKVLKEIIKIDCGNKVPRYLDSQKIFLFTNYKGEQSKGRRDTLKGMDVLAFQTEKGTFLFPVKQLMTMANSLFSLSTMLDPPVFESVSPSETAPALLFAEQEEK